MRYLVLVVSVLIEVCLGGVYAWSTFVPSLKEAGLSTAQTQLIFGTTFCVLTGLLIFAGRLQDRYGPRLIAPIGGVLICAGYLVCSVSRGSFWPTFIGYGVLHGAGIGFTYVCPLATSVKWFPHRKGLAGGMVIAGYGGGAMVLDRIVQWLFASGHDTFRVFGIIGVVYGGLVTILSLLLFTPTKVSLHEADRRIPVVDLLRDRSFLRLAMGMFCGTFAGMMVVGNVKSIGLSYGTTATVAAYSILAFAIGNATGRVSWGFIADRIGHRTIPLSLGFSTLAVAALVPLGGSSAFAYVAALVAFGFGANFVIYATEVAQRYGADAVGSVYPIVVVFYGLSSFAGPALGGKLYDTTGSYTASIITAAAVTALGILLTRLLVVTEPSLPSGAIDPGDLDEPEYSDIGVV